MASATAHYRSLLLSQAITTAMRPHGTAPSHPTSETPATMAEPVDGRDRMKTSATVPEFSTEPTSFSSTENRYYMDHLRGLGFKRIRT